MVKDYRSGENSYLRTCIVISDVFKLEVGGISSFIVIVSPADIFSIAELFKLPFKFAKTIILKSSCVVFLTTTACLFPEEVNLIKDTPLPFMVCPNKKFIDNKIIPNSKTFFVIVYSRLI